MRGSVVASIAPSASNTSPSSFNGKVLCAVCEKPMRTTTTRCATHNRLAHFQCCNMDANGYLYCKTPCDGSASTAAKLIGKPIRPPKRQRSPSESPDMPSDDDNVFRSYRGILSKEPLAFQQRYYASDYIRSLLTGEVCPSCTEPLHKTTPAYSCHSCRKKVHLLWDDCLIRDGPDSHVGNCTKCQFAEPGCPPAFESYEHRPFFAAVVAARNGPLGASSTSNSLSNFVPKSTASTARKRKSNDDATDGASKARKRGISNIYLTRTYSPELGMTHIDHFYLHAIWVVAWGC
ncbi:hypothetical protein BDR26DRAFT_997784 [Obelidium mucronatum]|nr:hypothetical protein BDR26DRAFT_997784 [Obelidium mucronatum]